jgi:hypothetical protein
MKWWRFQAGKDCGNLIDEKRYLSEKTIIILRKCKTMIPLKLFILNSAMRKPDQTIF